MSGTAPLTINRNADPAAAALAAAAAAKPHGDQPMGGEVRKPRQALADRARAEAASGSFGPQVQGSAEEAEEAAAPREDVEFIDIELPDGKVISFGPPAGISLTMRMTTGFGHMTLGQQAEARIKALMCIRSIDGAQVASVTGMLDAQKLANIIGDNALDLLTEALFQYWPPPRRIDLRIIQKKMRNG